MKVYLAGKIAKGEGTKDLTDWRIIFAEVLHAIGDVEVLSPENSSLDEGSPVLVFGHDCSLVQECDVLIVNASTKLGVGTSQEMIIAKYLGKPVITVLPKNTHHRRSNFLINGINIEDWIHPFIFSTSDLIVEKVEDSLKWLQEYKIFPKGKTIKTLEIIDKSIRQYNDSQKERTKK